MSALFLQGNALSVLKGLPADYFHCCVTSPPYFGLRKYDGGEEEWADGWRGQLGAEPTPDLYIQHLVEICREVRRVLRPDGVFFINVGDSWSSGRVQHELEHGICGKGELGSQVDGQIYQSPCGECLDFAASRKSDKFHSHARECTSSNSQTTNHSPYKESRSVHQANEGSSLPNSRIAPAVQDSARFGQLHQDGGVHGVQESTSPLSSARPRVGYSQMGSFSSCLSATFSTFQESLQCEHKMVCPFLRHLISDVAQVNVASAHNSHDTSLIDDALACRIWDRVFGFLSYRYSTTRPHHLSSIKPLDMVLIPEQLAIALRADGWYLRSILIWAKGVSCSDEYNGNPMPESVNGWRWERHKVKVSSQIRQPIGKSTGEYSDGTNSRIVSGLRIDDAGGQNTIWQDCPGCPKCEKNSGYVLRKGSWRPTDSFEYVLMLTKTNSYFCDREAVLERGSNNSHGGGQSSAAYVERATGQVAGWGVAQPAGDGGRNLRSVLMIPTAGFKGAHFAVFPPRLIEPLIKSATSEKGCCPNCGSPWARVIDKINKSDRTGELDYDSKYKVGGVTGLATQGFQRNETIEAERERSRQGAKLLFPNDERKQQDYINYIHDHGGLDKGSTIGWLPTCQCGIQETEPCRVLDPFSGAGTVSLVCERLGLDSIGIDTSAEYIQLAETRIADDEQMRINGQIKQLRKDAKEQSKKLKGVK